MSRAIRIDEVEEFELARRIPRQAVTPNILEGVRQLREAEEIEPFLREILTDPTQTAHGPNEIADVLTTHVTIAGATQLAAFVNKGRATPRVTSRNVGHQIIRLHNLPNLNLLVLLAVGDIQDNIKQDLLNVAKPTNADFLVIDAVDVARLFIAYQKLCPQCGLPFEKGHCRGCNMPASTPIKLSLDVYEEPHYERLSIEDMSTRIKRYKLRIRTDPHYSKAVLKEVIKRAVEDAKHERIYNSDNAERRFGNQEPDYIIVFVFLSIQDSQIPNPVCRAAWLRPGIEKSEAPFLASDAEKLGDIEISWSTVYDYIKQSTIGTKTSWIQRVSETFPEIEKLMDQARAYLSDFDNRGITRDQLNESLKQLYPRVEDVEARATATHVAPIECNDCDIAFQGLRGRFGNAFIAFAPHVREEESNSERALYLLRYSIRDYQADRERFLSELRKVDTRTYRKLLNNTP